MASLVLYWNIRSIFGDIKMLLKKHRLYKKILKSVDTRYKVMSQPVKLQKKQYGGVCFCVYSIAYWMPTQQKLTPPVLLFERFFLLGLLFNAWFTIFNKVDRFYLRNIYWYSRVCFCKTHSRTFVIRISIETFYKHFSFCNVICYY